jgi:hypothetical protein
MDIPINEHLESLKVYEQQHFVAAQNIINAYGNTVYYLDVLAIAVIKRSLALVSGFCSLIEARNFTCAAPLIRLQIDNCLRFYAASLVNNPHQFARQVMEGTPVRRLRDTNNRPLTDAYLIEKLSERHPELRDLYEEMSGYIHLSDKHILSMTTESQDNPKTISFRIASLDIHLDDSVYINAIHAFRSTTDILLEYLQQWVFAKANPHIIEQLRNRS